MDEARLAIFEISIDFPFSSMSLSVSLALTLGVAYSDMERHCLILLKVVSCSTIAIVVVNAVVHSCFSPESPSYINLTAEQYSSLFKFIR